MKSIFLGILLLLTQLSFAHNGHDSNEFKCTFEAKLFISRPVETRVVGFFKALSGIDSFNNQLSLNLPSHLDAGITAKVYSRLSHLGTHIVLTLHEREGAQELILSEPYIATPTERSIQHNDETGSYKLTCIPYYK